MGGGSHGGEASVARFPGCDSERLHHSGGDPADPTIHANVRGDGGAEDGGVCDDGRALSARPVRREERGLGDEEVVDGSLERVGGDAGIHSTEVFVVYLSLFVGDHSQ